MSNLHPSPSLCSPEPSLPRDRGRRGPTAWTTGLRAVAGALLLLGCEEVIVETVPVHTVRVVPGSAEIMVDEDVQLTAEVLDETQQQLNGREITWSSDDETVADVSASGMATGVGIGSTVIRATVEGRTGEASIEVREPDLTPPAAPAGLTATSVSETAIDLTWTDASDTETGFQVQRRTGANAFATIATLAAGSTAYSDTGLDPATSYDYRVLACNAAGCSDPSNVASATTGRVPPPAPSGLSATVVSAGRIDLSWTDNATTEDEFQVQRSVDGGAFSALATVGANVTAYSDDTTVEDTEYAYRVLACNAGGCSGPSNTAAATTPPTAPTGLTAASVSETEIDLTWTDASNTETEFQVQRRTGADAFATIATLPAGSTAYPDTGPDPATSYDYQILACNDAGCSDPSNVASATTGQVPPPAPSGLSATVVSAGQIDLAWTDVAAETYYLVQRSTDGGASFIRIDSLGVDGTAYSDTSTAADTQYAYRVLACNAGGCSSPSNTAAATTPPTAPTGLTAASVSETGIDLTWTDDSDTETEFQVQRRTGADAFATITTLPAGSAAYSDTGLDPATSYDYRVLACNDAGCSDPSNVASATTGQVPPPAPSGLSATVVSAGQIDLSWSDVDGEDEFQVQRSVDGGAFSALATVGVNVTAYSDDTTVEDTEYAYRVLACNAGGCSGPSNTAAATTPPAAPTGLSAASVSETGIDLTWTDASNTETEFQVQRRTGADAFATIATVAAGSTAYSDTGLDPATSYDYQILACNDAGCSDPSNVASATTGQVPPPAPSNLQATAVSPTRIDLGWADVTGETGYIIERSDDGGASFTEIAAPGENTTAYIDSGITDGTEYIYQVSACNAVGCSSPPSTATATTPVAPPTDLVAAATSDTSINVTWTDNSNVEDAYELDWREVGGTTWATISLGANVESHVQGGLDPGTSYEYRVRACSGAVCSTYAGPVTENTPAALAAPSGLTATVISANQIDLSWTDVAAETYYLVQRSIDGGANFIRIDSLGTNVTAYSDNSTVEDTEYAYRVLACNAGGCSAPSNTATATTPPAAASGATATALSAFEIEVAWMDNSDTETEFQIEHRAGPGKFTQVGTTPADATTYMHTGLTPETSHTYRVVACNDSGCAAASKQATTTTLEPPPTAPSGLNANVVSAGQVDLSWTDNASTEDEYRVQRSIDGGTTFTQIATLGIDTNAYTDLSVVADTEYTYRVDACNPGGCTSSGTVTGITPPTAPTGLEATAISESRIDLAWTDTSDTETEFQVQRSVEGGSFAGLDAVGADVTTYSDTSTSEETEYTYRVLACNGSGCSPPSGSATATTPDG